MMAPGIAKAIVGSLAKALKLHVLARALVNAHGGTNYGGSKRVRQSYIILQGSIRAQGINSKGPRREAVPKKGIGNRHKQILDILLKMLWKL